jgi:alpha-L-fucosidase
LTIYQEVVGRLGWQIRRVRITDAAFVPFTSVFRTVRSELMNWQLSILISVVYCFVFALCCTAEDAPAKTSEALQSYEPTWESLEKHNAAPDWFRDDKFGIYFHWGVYSVPAFGSEWYPRNMHLKGRRENEHHLDKYGDPGEFGYDSFVPMFKAEKFDAEQWADLFEKAGARFAGPVAEHHDGFSMWASKQTPWNALAEGPKRDLTGELEEAIRKRGMRFVATFHHARNNLWEKDGRWTGHYDGAKRDYAAALDDPKRAILYGYMPRDKFLRMWLGKLEEVIDNYQPDLIWFDSWLHEIPEDVQMEFLAYYFNAAEKWDKDVVVTFKQTDLPRTVAVDDYEKGRANRCTDFTWLTDDTISRGSWCYTENLAIKPTSEVVHVLADIVAKNGQLLLNISPKADGTIPDDQKEVLLGVGAWLKVNGDAIYETRPWVIFGEGPTRMKKGGHFVGSVAYSAQDVRFTTNGNALYAILLGQPTDDITIACLASDQQLAGGDVTKVSMLGLDGELEFNQTEDGLQVKVPTECPTEHAVALKIEGLKIQGFEPKIDELMRGNLWKTERQLPLTKFRDGKAVLSAGDAVLTGSGINTENRDNGKLNIGYWDDADEFASWQVEFAEVGEYTVSARIAAMSAGAFTIHAGDAQLAAQSKVTGDWGAFETISLGTIKIAAPGKVVLSVKPDPKNWAAMNLSQIELVKQ